MAQAKSESLRPLHTWTIKFKSRNRRDHWKVMIFPSCEALNTWVDRHGPNDPWADRQKGNKLYAAIVLTYRKPPAPRCAGYILFTTEFLTSPLIAHEMVHAALRTLGFGLGKRLCRRDEEKLAEITEHLFTEFEKKWARYAERKYLPKAG